MDKLNKVFDRIFVLTIPSFTDRIENMKQRLEGVDYEFFYGTYGGDLDVTPYREAGSRLTRGQLSCALSHYNIYKKIVEEDIQNALILEDDCIFTENINRIDEYAKQLPDEYSVFYLGFQEGSAGSGYSSNLNILTGRGVGHTHAMNVKKSCAELMLEFNKNLVWTADGAFNELAKVHDVKYLLANPIIINQDNGGGDDSTLVIVDKIYGFGF
ncbi:MAG: glycosyltransferase family 25 protein [Candidatus Hodarchaeales archaeon]|jgi:GR25 family glycosyltransferase involved in LPS biosynthesis